MLSSVWGPVGCVRLCVYVCVSTGVFELQYSPADLGLMSRREHGAKFQRGLPMGRRRIESCARDRVECTTAIAGGRA